MTQSEILAAMKQICEEKNISMESVIETIESALAVAYRKDFGEKNQNIKVEFDPKTTRARVFDVKTVVEDLPEEETKEDEKKEGEEEERKFDPKTEITLSEAKKIKKKIQIGEEIKTELFPPEAYGRMAAQTAKQVIIQKLREAERDILYKEYKDKEGEIVNGTIQRIEGRVILVDLGHTTAILPPQEQIKHENYASGQRLKFYIVSVNLTPKGPEIVISRTHPNMVKKLFTLEVPEINSGTIEIKVIAREAGSRSKIAVFSKQKNIDPIGSCVGQRGTRVQTVISELGGEKIDIVEWDEDPSKFIINSLSPAKVLSVKLNPEEKSTLAEVAEDQLSLAIGKGGQNVRLAAKLTGWKIDIIKEGTSGVQGGEKVKEVARESQEAKEKKEEETSGTKKKNKTKN